MTADGPIAHMIRDAPVQAIERPNGKFHGGPLLGDDPRSRRLRHTRRRVPVDSFAPALPDAVPLAGAYAYLGIAFSHFGHAMAEMIHRIVPTRRIVADPRWLILAQKGAEPAFAALPDVCRKVLGLFGVDDTNCTVVVADTIVGELLIVEAGSDLGGGPKEWYLDLLRVSGPAPVAREAAYPKKLYVSRSGLEQWSGMLGERMLEATLEGAGFHILHPARLTLAEQAAHYANAEVLMFAEGSACHGVEAFGGGALGHTILMNRRNRERSQFVPVLAPRATRFDFFTGNPYLGSVLVNPEGVPLDHRGVTAIALHALAAFLEEAGVATLGKVSATGYLAAAHADLERYLALAETGPLRADPRMVDGLRAALDDAILAGGVVAPAIPRIRARSERPARKRRAFERE